MGYPDAQSQHALCTPFAVNIGSPSAYLDGDRIIKIAKQEGCCSIHPGYGFLSENSAFAKKCTEEGLIFIGPPWKAIEAMGNKRRVLQSQSKDIMIAAGVPCIPGYHGPNQDPTFLEAQAEKIGFPVLLKAVKGGGGKGMRIVRAIDEFHEQLVSAKSEAKNSFGDDVMLVEKYITTPRHIEVQIFADKYGNCVSLGERDCSIQRRHQKILEESPAPHLAQDIREDLWAKARAAALAVEYEGAGTVEFIFDNETGRFFFMEMNTRLQVEHPVTEMVTGLDLVRWQFTVAEGGRLPLTQDEIKTRIAERGWGIEARIYAENPDMNFTPDSGRLVHMRTPSQTETVRIDAGFIVGDQVSSYYDPMISKLIVNAPSRREAIQKLEAALSEYEIVGPATNIEFLKKLCQSPAFVAGNVETGYIQKHSDELFAPVLPVDEVFAQAALGLLMQEMADGKVEGVFGSLGTTVGPVLGLQRRHVPFIQPSPNGTGEAVQIDVEVNQTGPATFDVRVNDSLYSSVTSRYETFSRVLTSFFPHTRLSTTIVRNGNSVTVFHKGKQYRLECVLPNWVEKALGVKDVANSVLTPMPCKVLRVEVREGDKVTKDQSLVVIESMKMEMVIRSPQDGVISRVVYGEGVGALSKTLDATTLGAYIYPGHV
ncbi:hypothetical protein FGG08_005772 [Glutinoglossum americanum]|uniref:Uncharacterized protein n=1 Tax=Glutinoglossum americanum TaxID=1670608 RepID=A0A9P8HXH9_9PEZI|nr:hypothetical protein FGG08_005772 [Glutinoglossum americanum]